MSTIYSLVYSPGESDHTPPYRFNRRKTDQVRLIAGHGIEGDYKAGHNPDRQLNIMTYETLQQLAAAGFQVEPGQMGEQIIVQGLVMEDLPSGTQVQMGEAVIEVIKPRSGCAWFIQIQGKAAPPGGLGVMAKVVKSGIVQTGDSVRIKTDVPLTTAE